jgi:hypothetical protein
MNGIRTSIIILALGTMGDVVGVDNTISIKCMSNNTSPRHLLIGLWYYTRRYAEVDQELNFDQGAAWLETPNVRA